MDEEMNEYLPNIRCTPSMKASLLQIASASATNRLSDHIRLAIQQYIERESTKRLSIEDYEHLAPRPNSYRSRT